MAWRACHQAGLAPAPSGRPAGLKNLRGGEQQDGGTRVYYDVDVGDVGAGVAVKLPEAAGAKSAARESAEEAVAALYQASALSLIRMAYVMLDDLQGAEDVVQEAFYGLYRRWNRLKDADHAIFYVRAAVLNGCRSALRRRAVRRRLLADQPGQPGQRPAASAEAVVIQSEEREEVIRALTRLPHRQREALVLRFYLELSDEQIARVMDIRQSTVRSTVHRALEALGRDLKETS
jgi:RNA polymerase sigma-70 factor (sigma-E family)